MNEYMKPDYEVMVFEANEYVAACEWEQGTDLTIGCNKDYSYHVELTANNGKIEDNVYIWTANIINDKTGQASGSQMLYPVYKKNDSFNGDSVNSKSEFDFFGYGFSGTITDKGHTTSNYAGEYQPGQDNLYLVGSYSDGTGYGLVGSAFHLLSYVLNHDHS